MNDRQHSRNDQDGDPGESAQQGSGTDVQRLTRSSVHPSDQERDDGRSGLSPWQVVGSTVASAFGVQSSRNRERDFSRGKASHFIIAGVVFTVLFVLGVLLVVNLVLSAAA